jgi:hypothetical protein
MSGWNMSFKDLFLKRNYSSDIDDLLFDFYIPVLNESISYFRISGFLHLNLWQLLQEEF